MLMNGSAMPSGQSVAAPLPMTITVPPPPLAPRLNMPPLHLPPPPLPPAIMQQQQLAPPRSSSPGVPRPSFDVSGHLPSSQLQHEQGAVQRVVAEVMSRGVFDSLRRQCLADCDTRPAYQNLHARVSRFVRVFLGQQKWSPGVNRNQLRERMGRQLLVSPFLDIGVERIIDQVVSRNACTVYSQRVRDLVNEIVFSQESSKSNHSSSALPGQAAVYRGSEEPNSTVSRASFMNDESGAFQHNWLSAAAPQVAANTVPRYGDDAEEDDEAASAPTVFNQFGLWYQQFCSSYETPTSQESEIAATPVAEECLSRCSESEGQMDAEERLTNKPRPAAVVVEETVEVSEVQQQDCVDGCLETTGGGDLKTSCDSELEEGEIPDDSGEDEADSPSVMWQMSPLSEAGSERADVLLEQAGVLLEEQESLAVPKCDSVPDQKSSEVSDVTLDTLLTAHDIRAPTQACNTTLVGESGEDSMGASESLSTRENESIVDSAEISSAHQTSHSVKSDANMVAKTVDSLSVASVQTNLSEHSHQNGSTVTVESCVSSSPRADDNSQKASNSGGEVKGSLQTDEVDVTAKSIGVPKSRDDRSISLESKNLSKVPAISSSSSPARSSKHSSSRRDRQSSDISAPSKSSSGSLKPSHSSSSRHKDYRRSHSSSSSRKRHRHSREKSTDSGDRDRHYSRSKRARLTSDEHRVSDCSADKRQIPRIGAGGDATSSFSADVGSSPLLSVACDSDARPTALNVDRQTAVFNSEDTSSSAVRHSITVLSSDNGSTTESADHNPKMASSQAGDGLLNWPVKTLSSSSADTVSDGTRRASSSVSNLSNKCCCQNDACSGRCRRTSKSGKPPLHNNYIGERTAPKSPRHRPQWRHLCRALGYRLSVHDNIVAGDSSLLISTPLSVVRAQNSIVSNCGDIRVSPPTNCILNTSTQTDRKSAIPPVTSLSTLKAPSESVGDDVLCSPVVQQSSSDIGVGGRSRRKRAPVNYVALNSGDQF